MNNCIFCNIVESTAEATFVYRDKVVSVFMDTQPINTGHILIIPNMHATFLADLDLDTGAHMFRIAQQMAQAIRNSSLPCEGINMFLADGKAAMQEVLHVHLHVFPRFKGDGFVIQAGEAYFTKPTRAELETVAGRIKAKIEPSAAHGCKSGAVFI